MWAAETHRLPSSFLTRGLWQESGFRTVCENGSTEAVAAENRGAYRRIGLRLAVSGEYAAIVKLLGAVDGATPPLVLSNLQIRAIVRPTGDPSNARLDAGFEVYGFRNSEAPLPLQR